MKKTQGEIAEEIKAILRAELDLPSNSPIPEDANFSRDLGFDSDDLSFLFIPAIERAFRVKLTFEQWTQIGTVKQLTEALTKSGS